MGERLLCKQEVIGSIPFTSTTDAPKALSLDRARCERQARRMPRRKRIRLRADPDQPAPRSGPRIAGAPWVPGSVL